MESLVDAGPVKARLESDIRDLIDRCCAEQRIIDPYELQQTNCPLSAKLPSWFEDELLSLLKKGAVDLLAAYSDSRTTLPDALLVLEKTIKPYLEDVWVKAEDLPDHMKQSEVLRSPLLRDLFVYLVKAAHDIGAASATDSSPKPQRLSFPNRAEWLTMRFKERNWNKHDPKRFGGPEHKTVQKILDGHKVREDSLGKLITALSQKCGPVSPLDMPQD